MNNLLTKENCKLMKISTPNPDTGEIVSNTFISHPDHTNYLKITNKKDGEKVSYEEHVAYCKANPSWRNQILVSEHPEYGFSARFSLSEIEVADV